MRSVKEMRNALIASVVVLAGATASQASLIVDLRPVSGPRTISVAQNQVVPLQIWAVVSGANTTDDETFTNAFVKLSSSTGGLLGNFSVATVDAAFQGTGFTPGVPSDQDGDLDLDLGLTTNASYMFARSPTALNGNRTGADSEEFLLGTINFTVTGASGSTTLIPVKPATGISAPALFVNDATNSTAAGYLSSGHLGVTLEIVPEPATIGLLAMSSLAMLARRRRA